MLEVESYIILFVGFRYSLNLLSPPHALGLGGGIAMSVRLGQQQLPSPPALRTVALTLMQSHVKTQT